MDELVCALAELIVPQFSRQVYLLELGGCDYPQYRELALANPNIMRAPPGSSDRAYVKYWRIVHQQATTVIIKHPGSVDVSAWQKVLKGL